jgi:prepilin-type processing-associated H-X9-DG protein
MTDGTSTVVIFAEKFNACPPPARWGNVGRGHWLGTRATAADNVFAWNTKFVLRPRLGDEGFTQTIDVPQIAPDPFFCNMFRVQTPHPGALNALLLDGSVQRIGEIDSIVWRHYVLRSDGIDDPT